MVTKTSKKISLLKLSSTAKATARGASTSLLVIFSILLLLIGKIDEKSLKYVESLFLDVSSVFLKLIGKPFETVNSGLSEISELVFLYAKNKDLEKENVELYKWKELGQKLLIENEELKQALKFASSVEHSYITAKVISNSAASYIKTITINVGKKNGVKVGNAVMNNWGMIGRVVNAGNKSSRVLLTTDINSQIPIYFERSKHKAILIGKNNDVLEIKFLKNRALILDNDRIITSGEGGLLPRGLNVGSYFKKMNSNKNKVLIAPTRNWDRLNILNVILFDKEPL